MGKNILERRSSTSQCLQAGRLGHVCECSPGQSAGVSKSHRLGEVLTPSADALFVLENQFRWFCKSCTGRGSAPGAEGSVRKMLLFSR